MMERLMKFSLDPGVDDAGIAANSDDRSPKDPAKITEQGAPRIVPRGKRTGGALT
jgi:hypothetical protein